MHSEVIAATLKAHEEPNANVQTSGAQEQRRTSEEQRKADAEGSSSGEEFEDVEEQIHVQGKLYGLSEVLSNPLLVQQMTADEKANYIEISQKAMQHFD